MIPKFEGKRCARSFTMALRSRGEVVVQSTAVIPTGGPLHGYSCFRTGHAKIFIAQHHALLKFWLFYIIFLRHLSLIRKHKTTLRTVIAHANLCFCLGGPLPALIQYRCEYPKNMAGAIPIILAMQY